MPKHFNIRSLPVNKSSKNDCTKLLADLGKSTRRGIRKCPNCGYQNGTRGNMCKNSLCNMIFKDSEKRKIQLDSIKLITGTARQIYSVRVQDKGPDDRGFVQLPFYENEEKNLLSEVALCFVDSCQRLFDNSILKCHEHELNNRSPICAHIESALKSMHVATALEFKHDLINNLNVDDDVKKKLCSLAKSTQGPVVQRVSKSVMAVKCLVTPTNPLGYLHLNLYSSKGDNLDDVDLFYCSCTDNLSQTKESKSDSINVKCIHYFACICAFASDAKFTNKFSHLIQTELDALLLPSYEFNLVNMLDSENMEESIHPILSKDTILHFTDDELSVRNSSIKIEVLPTDFIFEPEKIHSQILSVPYTITNGNKRTKMPKERINVKKKMEKHKPDMYLHYFDVLSFNEWLPSVTEAINSVMCYEGNGKPDPLVFHIPNKFFELLKDRICYTTKNHTTQSIRRDIPPKGTYLQTVFHITNMKHLKEIFHTARVSLQETKLFAQDTTGVFIESDDKTEIVYMKNTTKFITYLKVGIVDDDEEAFVIEWIGNLYKLSKFGELKLSFQYGHKLFEIE